MQILGPAGDRRGRAQAQARPARVDVVLALGQAVRIVHGDGGKAEDVLPAGAAQQLVDGHAQLLAQNVPERDVDGADGPGQHAAALVVVAAIALLPDVLDAHGVHADQEAAEMLDRLGLGQLARRAAAFAQAVDALVGLDLDHERCRAPP